MNAETTRWQELKIPSPLQKIDSPVFVEQDISVFVKRDDMIHAEVSGNKWRKLKYNIEKFKAGNYHALLTFGGAYSNHIAATAAFGNMAGVPTIGVIRGDELHAQSNDTLRAASENKMQFHFVTRQAYQKRYDANFHAQLKAIFGNVYIVPEGGANNAGAEGCSEIMHEIPFTPDYVYTAAGTGTTAAGLLVGSLNGCIINTVSALKGGEFLSHDIQRRIQSMSIEFPEANLRLKDLRLITDMHFGGYGKHNATLLANMKSFTDAHGIPLDQVYTGKMVSAFLRDLHDGFFKKNSRIVLLHTGGLQGAIPY
ncbi:MAG: pyridoxal-phosphate dependent enzyme [Crocinitomicaceae bacterium]|nr:pyridoxal-phosphate dependent enzyme [Crocinitomicaceae bacterium]MBK8924779.1 pyridoxal-phosphate dependent enzyme [Crocinitomicaceae bacterium]